MTNTSETSTTTETKWEPLKGFQYLCEIADAQIRKGKTIDETLEYLGVYCKEKLTQDQLTAILVTTYSRNDIFSSNTMLGGDWITFLIGCYSRDWKFETYFAKLNLPTPYEKFNPKSIQALVLLFMAFQSIKKDPASGAKLRKQQRRAGVMIFVLATLMFVGSAVATVFLFTAGWLVSLTIAGVFAGIIGMFTGIKELVILDSKLRKYAP